MTEHERILLLAAAAIDFRLTPAEGDQLADHLRSCDACRPVAQALHQDAVAIAAIPRRQPSASIERRLAVEARAVRPTYRPTLAFVIVSILLLLALVGAVLVGSYLLRTERDPFALLLPSAMAPSPETTTPDPAPGPTPTPAPGTTWQAVTDVPALTDVIAGGPGWIGVARTGALIPQPNAGLPPLDRSSHIWTSVDGESWIPVEDPMPTGSSVLELATGPAGTVAVGDQCCSSAGVWHAVDVTTAPVISLGAEFFPTVCCSAIHLVAVGSSGYVVIGTGDDLRALAWASADGERWTRSPGYPFDDAGLAVGTESIAAGRAGYVVAGWAGDASAPRRPTFWASEDGRDWTLVAQFAAPGAGTPQPSPPARHRLTEFALEVVAGGPGFVAVGGRRDLPNTVAWTSPDGRTWTERLIDASAGPGGLASDGERVLIVTDDGTAVWVSDDGLDWTRHPVGLGPLEVRAIAGGDHGFVIVGEDPSRPGSTVAWLSP